MKPEIPQSLDDPNSTFRDQMKLLAIDRIHSAVAKSRISTVDEYVLACRLGGDGMPLGVMAFTDDKQKLHRGVPGSIYVEIGVPLQEMDVRNPVIAQNVGGLLLRRFTKRSHRVREQFLVLPDVETSNSSLRLAKRALMSFQMVPMREKLQSSEA